MERRGALGGQIASGLATSRGLKTSSDLQNFWILQRFYCECPQPSTFCLRKQSKPQRFLRVSTCHVSGFILTALLIFHTPISPTAARPHHGFPNMLASC